MKRVWGILKGFVLMYVVATVLGFGTYLLLTPDAMWISVFTVMPLISAWLIFRYLRQMRFDPRASLRESSVLLLAWIVLSFAADACTYIVIVPTVNHAAPNWTFFRDQSPWIWLSYAVLGVSALLGQQAYLIVKAMVTKPY